MARCEHLPIYKKAMELSVYLEETIKNFSCYHKYAIGTELRSHLRRILRLIIDTNSARERQPLLHELARQCDMLSVGVRNEPQHSCRDFPDALPTGKDCRGGVFLYRQPKRSSRLLIERIGDLQVVVRQVRCAHPLDILAWVVMPEHIHALWRLPEDDAEYSMRWSLIKAGFSRRLAKMEPISNSRECKGERRIWQRRFWEHLIRNETDLRRHVEYIHYNPIRHGYVGRVRDWPFFTFHSYVRQGLLCEDWGGEGDDGATYGN